MLVSKRAVCYSKNSKFIKEQDATRLLSSLTTKILSSKLIFDGSLLIVLSKLIQGIK